MHNYALVNVLMPSTLNGYPCRKKSKENANIQFDSLVFNKKVPMWFALKFVYIYSKSARNHQPKSCMPAKSHRSQWDARPILFQLKSLPPFSLFLFR